MPETVAIAQTQVYQRLEQGLKDPLTIDRPLMTLADVLNQPYQTWPKTFSLTSSYFDPRLSCSLNLCPLFQPGKNIKEIPAFAPFNFYQKETDYALAIEDTATGQLQLLMLDGNEAKYFKEKLTQDLSSQATHSVHLSLYHFDSQSIIHGKQAIDPSRFKLDSDLLQLIVQAKFFRGDVSYNKEELPILKAWLEKSDVGLLEKLFTEQILEWKQESRIRYPGSNLDKLFTNLSTALPKTNS